MILKIDGKFAAKTLVGMNDKVIVCVNCKFFENSPKYFQKEFDCYGLLSDVIKTGVVEGLKIQETVLEWLKKENERINCSKLKVSI